MNPVTHVLAGWVVVDRTSLCRRDRNLITLSLDLFGERADNVFVTTLPRRLRRDGSQDM